MDKIRQILKIVVNWLHFEAVPHIKNQIKNSDEADLGGAADTLGHVLWVHILMTDKNKFQINDYSDNISS
jgi:hypothetical protein